MKLLPLVCILFFFSIQVQAQLNGNGKLKTITTEIKNLQSMDIQFNAKITLDYSLKEEMIITADENILEFIGQDFINGKLTLDQEKWIEPSQMPTITIGTPHLKSIYQGTHSTTRIHNINVKDLTIKGNVGKILATGNADNISVITTGTDVDLSKLTITNAYVSIDDDSKVVLDKVSRLETELSKKSRLILLSDIEGYISDQGRKVKNENLVNPDLKWIEFKIKNNSLLRNHFVVQGPKKDGSYFSYGFSLFPGKAKSERWSVGTKIYRETRSGGRELLVIIASNDEGKIVKLFN